MLYGLYFWLFHIYSYICMRYITTFIYETTKYYNHSASRDVVTIGLCVQRTKRQWVCDSYKIYQG